MTFHAPIGTVSLGEDDLVKNALEVFTRVTSKLDRGVGNIRSVYIKTTMGPAHQVEVIA